MRDPVRGKARVVSHSAFTTPGRDSDRADAEVTLQAQVVVTADGVEPTAAELVADFPRAALPLPAGSDLPVIIDRKRATRRGVRGAEAADPRLIYTGRLRRAREEVNSLEALEREPLRGSG
jgi:hypothetical protein